MTTKTLDSPFGPVSFAVEDGFLLRVRFQADINSTENDDPLAEEAVRKLDAYFTGRLFNFDLPLAPPYSEFQAGIRQCMIDIPFGEMRTYGELAKDLGSASQAVGQACGANPFRSSSPVTGLLPPAESLADSPAATARRPSENC